MKNIYESKYATSCSIYPNNNSKYCGIYYYSLLDTYSLYVWLELLNNLLNRTTFSKLYIKRY